VAESLGVTLLGLSGPTALELLVSQLLRLLWGTLPERCGGVSCCRDAGGAGVQKLPRRRSNPPGGVSPGNAAGYSVRSGTTFGSAIGATAIWIACTRIAVARH
jgi:hypothetical protein